MSLAMVLALFLWLLGLCVGSFLNVVIYRLPHGLSVHEPKRSFCPQCRTTLRAVDNIPVVSWLLLGGRCRYCRAPVSLQYPLVESVTGLAFVLAFHLLFVAQARYGLEDATLPRDAPLLLAWLILIAALVACAGMDFVSYMVDTRVTDAAMFAGIALYACWPNEPYLRHTYLTPALLAAGCAAFLAAGAMLALSAWRAPHAESPEDAPAAEAPKPMAAAKPTASAAAVTAIAALLGITAALVVIDAPGPVSSGVVAFAFAALVLTLLLAGGHPRDADKEIHDVIEQEAGQSRRVALREFVWLLPILAAAAAAYLLVARIPAAASAWSALLAWSPGGGFVPLAGASVSVTGAMVAAAAGWLIRIPFTLLFGREAFGTGDIFILAAAGAVAGWDLALLGFMLSIGIGLVAWIGGLFLKRSTMIAFGPPMAVGFVLALWWNPPAARVGEVYAGEIRTLWETRPELLLAGAGIVLAAVAPAVLVSRLVRRSLESAFPEEEER